MKTRLINANSQAVESHLAQAGHSKSATLSLQQKFCLNRVLLQSIIKCSRYKRVIYRGTYTKESSEVNKLCYTNHLKLTVKARRIRTNANNSFIIKSYNRTHFVLRGGGFEGVDGSRTYDARIR